MDVLANRNYSLRSEDDLSMGHYPDFESYWKQGNIHHVFEIYRSFRSLLPLILLFVLLTIVLFGVADYVYDATDGDSHSLSLVRWLAIMPAVALIELVRRYYDNLWIIGMHRIVHFRGRLSLTSSRSVIRYADIRAIFVNQGLFARMMNYGTIEISTAAQDNAELAIKGAVAPHELARIIDGLRQMSAQNRDDPASEEAQNAE